MYLYHAIVDIAGSVSDFKFNHDRAGTNVAACKWHAWTVYCTTVAAVNRRNTTRYMVDASSFCCPVEVNAAIHSTCAERYRSAVVIRSVIKYGSRYKCHSKWAVIGERYNCMLITVSHRNYIIYNCYVECTCAYVSAFVSCNPGNYVCTQA